MAEGNPTRAWRCAPGAFRDAVRRVRLAGGVIEGGDSEGKLTAQTPLGRLEGMYSFDGEELTVTILRKPSVVPVSMIWDQLDQVFGPPVTKA